MIKIKVNEGNTEIDAGGDVITFASDCMTGIHVVYESMQADNPICAEMFKHMIVNNISLAFCDEDGLDSKIEELKKEKRKKVEESVSNTLKELVEILDGGCSLTDAIKRLHNELEG